MEDQPPTLRHQKYHKMSKYLVYLINSKTTCICLTRIDLYEKNIPTAPNFLGLSRNQAPCPKVPKYTAPSRDLQEKDLRKGFNYM